MTRPSETAPVRPAAGDGNRHLIHCPSSWDHHLLDAPSLGEERFVLTGDLPVRHPLFNDGPGRFHDPQVTMEAVAEVCALTGHHYFGVPRDRTGLFHRFGVELTEPTVWRCRAGGVSRMAVDLTVAPAHFMNGVPRGLDLRWEVRIDDVPCATGGAGLVFLMPKLYRRHLTYSSRVLREAPEPADGPATRPVPVEPSAVGRARGENVVVGEPETDVRGRLRVWLLTEGVSPVITGLHDELTGTHLLESLRQAALLAAGRSGGLDPARCVMGRTEVNFRAQAGLDLPMRCVAVAGRRTRDAQGRTAVPVTLTVTQARRPVADAVLSVVQDF